MEEYECTNELRWLEVTVKGQEFRGNGVNYCTQDRKEIVLQQAWVGKYSGDVDWRDVPTKVGE